MDHETYCHWGYGPSLVLQDDYDYSQYRLMMFKPHGLWITTDSEDGWREWCLREEFGCGSYRFDLRIKPEANLLWLKTEEEMIEFTDEYELKDNNPVKGLRFWLDWQRVMDKYQGIMIFPCQYRMRMDDRTTWYNPWDCASGCIWKPASVLEIIDYDLPVR